MLEIIKTSVKEALNHNSLYGHVMAYYFSDNTGVSGTWNTQNKNIEVCQFVHDRGRFRHFDVDTAEVVANHLEFAKYVQAFLDE